MKFVRNGRRLDEYGSLSIGACGDLAAWDYVNTGVRRVVGGSGGRTERTIRDEERVPYSFTMSEGSKLK